MNKNANDFFSLPVLENRMQYQYFCNGQNVTNKKTIKPNSKKSKSFTIYFSHLLIREEIIIVIIHFKFRYIHFIVPGSIHLP